MNIITGYIKLKDEKIWQQDNHTIVVHQQKIGMSVIISRNKWIFNNSQTASANKSSINNISDIKKEPLKQQQQQQQ